MASGRLVHRSRNNSAIKAGFNFIQVRSRNAYKGAMVLLSLTRDWRGVDTVGVMGDTFGPHGHVLPLSDGSKTPILGY